MEEEGEAAVLQREHLRAASKKEALYVYIKKRGGKVTLHQKFFLFFPPLITPVKRERAKKWIFFSPVKKYPGGDGGGF